MKKIELTYQKNVRDLGGMTGFEGKKVKYNRIFRGGYLGKVSDEDVKVINSLRLTDIIDFRSMIEFNSRPDFRFIGVTYTNLPAMKEEAQEGLKGKNVYEDSNLLWFLGESTDGFGHMYNLYPELLLSQEGIKAYSTFFEILSKDNRVVYFHCSQGKDRAGLAAYLLEIALGVSPSDAREDYLLSNEAMAIKTRGIKFMLKDKHFYNRAYEKALDDVFAARGEYLDHALQKVIEQCGSVMEYIKNILHVDVDKLRKIYLE